MKKSSLIKTLSIAGAVFCVTVCTQMTARYAPFHEEQQRFISALDDNDQEKGEVKEVPMIKEDSVAEPEMLQNLDKESRGVYYSLTEDGKKYAREQAAQTADFKGAVQAALKNEAEKRAKMNDHMLHNGMDRIPEKK